MHYCVCRVNVVYFLYKSLFTSTTGPCKTVSLWEQVVTIVTVTYFVDLMPVCDVIHHRHYQHSTEHRGVPVHILARDWLCQGPEREEPQRYEEAESRDVNP